MKACKGKFKPSSKHPVGSLVNVALTAYLDCLEESGFKLPCDPIIASIPMAAAAKQFEFTCSPDASQCVSQVLLMDVPTLLVDHVIKPLKTKAEELGGVYSLFYIPISDELISYMK